jgi:phosphohistidine phosphatase
MRIQSFIFRRRALRGRDRAAAARVAAGAVRGWIFSWRVSEMELYLVQHGESKPESEDPERRLTERGRKEVERVARAAARLRLTLEAIAHSGKPRARQTAEILAAHLAPTRGPREMEGLAPKDDPARARQAVERAEEPLMLVGHLPHLSRLASLLVVGDPDREIVAFRMGGIVCLTRKEEKPDAAGAGASAPGGWRLKWILTPELAAD